MVSLQRIKVGKINKNCVTHTEWWEYPIESWNITIVLSSSDLVENRPIKVHCSIQRLKISNNKKLFQNVIKESNFAHPNTITIFRPGIKPYPLNFHLDTWCILRFIVRFCLNISSFDTFYLKHKLM